MKISYKPIALLAVLSIAAAGCQKEPIVEPTMQFQQNVNIRNVTYTIDGVTFFATVRGEQNWHDFIDRLLALAKEGHKVSFRNGDVCQSGMSAKETVHYYTNNSEDARNWCVTMADKGYSVSMEYDDETGRYHCTAIKPDIVNPQTDTTDTGEAK